MTAPKVITEEVRLGKRTAPDEERISLPTRQILFRIGGHVTDAGDGPVADATDTLVGTGFATRTGTDGNYSLGSIPAGTYAVRVQSGATTKDLPITIKEDH